MKSETLRATLGRVAIPVIAINAVALWATTRGPIAAAWAPHAPDWGLFLRAGWVVQLHTLAALSALLTALFLLARTKGSRLHRRLGWAWAVLMMTTAVSSLFLRALNPGHLSLVHILAGWTAFATPWAVWAARNHHVRLHQRLMTGLVIGGLVIAGALTFVPGRLMWKIFFG